MSQHNLHKALLCTHTLLYWYILHKKKILNQVLGFVLGKLTKLSIMGQKNGFKQDFAKLLKLP